MNARQTNCSKGTNLKQRKNSIGNTFVEIRLKEVSVKILALFGRIRLR